MAASRWLLICLSVSLLRECVSDVTGTNTTIGQLVNSAIDHNRSILENAAMIQQSLCKGMATCNRLNRDHTNVAMSIPPTLAAIDERLPGCCYPCSCRDDCLEIGNCCLDKLADLDEFKNDLELLSGSMTDNIRTECIPANILAYTNQLPRKATLLETSYRIIKGCPKFDIPSSMKYRCTNPNHEVIGEAVPVSSVTSGIIYYNRYCAQCNNETDVTSWQVLLSFKENVIDFCQGQTAYDKQCISVSNDISVQFKAAVKYVRASVRAYVRITYSPPDSHTNVGEMRCSPTTLLYTANSVCDDTDSGLQPDTRDLLNTACSVIQTPFLFGARRYPNVFCAICDFGQRERVFANVNQNQSECIQSATRTVQFTYIAVLKYSLPEDEAEVTKENRKTDESPSPCGCFGTMNPHQNACRPLYCPPGEKKQGCQCNRIIKEVSGKQVVLHLKLNPHNEEAANASLTEGYGENILRSLMPLLAEEQGKGLKFRSMLLFTNENTSRPYYHAVVVVKTPPAIDAIEFLCQANINLEKEQRIYIGKSMFIAALTSSFGNKQLDEVRMTIVPTHLDELKMKLVGRPLQIVYNFTKLSCCKYAMLGPEEVIEINNDLFLNATRNPIPDVFWHQGNGGYIGICEDDYAVLAKPHGHVSGTSAHGAWLENIFWLLIAVQMLGLI